MYDIGTHKYPRYIECENFPRELESLACFCVECQLEMSSGVINLDGDDN